MLRDLAPSVAVEGDARSVRRVKDGSGAGWNDDGWDFEGVRESLEGGCVASRTLLLPVVVLVGRGEGGRGEVAWMRAIDRSATSFIL